MKFFIEGMNCGIWKVVKEGQFVLTQEDNGVLVNKPKNDWTKDYK